MPAGPCRLGSLGVAASRGPLGSVGGLFLRCLWWESGGEGGRGVLLEDMLHGVGFASS